MPSPLIGILCWAYWTFWLVHSPGSGRPAPRRGWKVPHPSAETQKTDPHPCPEVQKTDTPSTEAQKKRPALAGNPENKKMKRPLWAE